MISLVALVLAASVGPVAFEVPGGYAIVSRQGELLDKFRWPEGKEVVDLAVSPSGATYVFTAKDREHPQALLYRLDKGETTPTVLGSGIGFHAQPSFTNDGEWVFFVHHPSLDGGPPGAHGMRNYGQIWRIRLDGSGLAQVTRSKGCKRAPDGRDQKHVAFAHADCGSGSSIEVLAAGDVQVVYPMSSAIPQFPKYSSDGKTLAAARLEAGRVVVVTCTPPRPCEPLATLPRDAEPSQLAWAENDKALMLSLGPTLWWIERSDGSTRNLLNLLEVFP